MLMLIVEFARCTDQCNLTIQQCNGEARTDSIGILSDEIRDQLRKEGVGIGRDDKWIVEVGASFIAEPFLTDLQRRSLHQRGLQ